MYNRVLGSVLPYQIQFETAAEAFELIAKLATPPADIQPGSAGATSFAFTARQPALTVWLSRASYDRIRDEFNDFDLWSRIEAGPF